MYITNISLFVSRVTAAFLFSLVVTAAYSQHNISGTSVVADNIQLKPSGRIKQNDNLLIAQIQTGNCRQPVAEALASNELGNKRFVIEGHTDAKGKASYNLSLSKRRAQAVKQYLVNKFAIDPSRLATVGKGSSELLNSAAPYASENRRVVIALPR